MSAEFLMVAPLDGKMAEVLVVWPKVPGSIGEGSTIKGIS